MKRTLFTILVLAASPAWSQNADIDLLKSINKHETSFKNKYLELNASSTTALGIGIPAGMAIAGFISKDKQLQQDALFMGAAFLATGLVTQSTKRIADRKRPFESYSFIITRDDESGGLSFPSGHTSSAFCTATSLSLRYPKWYVIAPSCLFACSVGWARMYQGVHYPSDVLAGALVGAGSAWVGWKMQKWIMGKKHPKKKLTL
ncbi:MAG: phosphatase PAP2 family protein [Ferruginibacter sp.]